jgi:hypothetical protein
MNFLQDLTKLFMINYSISHKNTIYNQTSSRYMRFTKIKRIRNYIQKPDNFSQEIIYKHTSIGELLSGSYTNNNKLKIILEEDDTCVEDI